MRRFYRTQSGMPAYTSLAAAIARAESAEGRGSIVALVNGSGEVIATLYNFGTVSSPLVGKIGPIDLAAASDGTLEIGTDITVSGTASASWDPGVALVTDGSDEVALHVPVVMFERIDHYARMAESLTLGTGEKIWAGCKIHGTSTRIAGGAVESSGALYNIGIDDTAQITATSAGVATADGVAPGRRAFGVLSIHRYLIAGSGAAAAGDYFVQFLPDTLESPFGRASGAVVSVDYYAARLDSIFYSETPKKWAMVL